MNKRNIARINETLRFALEAIAEVKDDPEWNAAWGSGEYANRVLESLYGKNYWKEEK